MAYRCGLVFITGEMVIAESYNIVHESGKEYYEMKMVMTEYVIKSHNINTDRLDYSNPEFVRWGLLKRRYLASDIIFLSNSPSNPVWLCLSCFDGSPADVKGTKLGWVIRLRDQLEAAKEENSRLRGTVEEKDEELRLIFNQTAKWYKKKGLVFDPTAKVSDLLAKTLAMSKKTT